MRTAEEWVQLEHGEKFGLFDRHQVKELMIAFAKAHVEKALKIAMYKADEKEISSTTVNEYYREQILNAYPLTNIK